MAEAVQAGKALTTTPAHGGSTSSWIIAFCAVCILIGTIVKNWPAILKTINGRLDSLDEERRGDIALMKLEMVEIKKEAREARENAEIAQRRAQSFESQLATTVTVIGMLTRRIKREWPNDPLLEEVSSMLEIALSSDGGFRDGIAKIIAATIRD